MVPVRSMPSLTRDLCICHSSERALEFALEMALHASHETQACKWDSNDQCKHRVERSTIVRRSPSFFLLVQGNPLQMLARLGGQVLYRIHRPAIRRQLASRRATVSGTLPCKMVRWQRRQTLERRFCACPRSNVASHACKCLLVSGTAEWPCVGVHYNVEPHYVLFLLHHHHPDVSILACFTRLTPF